MNFATKRQTPPSDDVQNPFWQSVNDCRWFLNKNKFEITFMALKTPSTPLWQKL